MPTVETGTWNSGELMRNTVRLPFFSPSTPNPQGCPLIFIEGKFVRFGPNSLSVNSNTALSTIYGFHSNVQKSVFYSAFPPTKDTFNTHSSIDKHAHARKRRVLSHAFSDTAVKAMEKYILQNVRAFTDGLGRGSSTNAARDDDKKGWSVAQNMADWCNYLTFDVMGDLCFGKAFGMLEKPDNRFAISLIGNAAHRHLIVSHLRPPHLSSR
jgi:hypothetical protein